MICRGDRDYVGLKPIDLLIYSDDVRACMLGPWKGSWSARHCVCL